MDKFSVRLLAVVAALATCMAGQDRQDQQNMDRQHQQTHPASAASDNLVRGSQIAGQAINGSDGQSIGTIEDVVIDRNTGDVAFVIAAFSPSLNKGDKLFAIPWTALRKGGDTRTFAVELPKDRLETVPAFERMSWPTMDSQWSNQVYTFYGVRPSMNGHRMDGRDATAGFDRNREDRRDFDRDRADQRRDDVNRDNRDFPNRRMDGDRGDLARREITVINGKVRSFQQGDPSILAINSSSGEIRAELAPRTFVEQQRLTFDNDTDVTVRGFYDNRGGQRTFVVTEVTTRDGRTVRLRRDDSTPLWAGAATDREYTAYDRPMHGTERTAGAYTINDLTGTVSYIQPAGGCDESAQGRLVYLRTDRGERVIALGPGEYLTRNRWDLRPNETVTIRGYESSRDGRGMFMATEVRRGNETWRLRREDGTPLW